MCLSHSILKRLKNNIKVFLEIKNINGKIKERQTWVSKAKMTEW